MIQETAMLLTLVGAGLNRKWRGEGQAPRWAWYGMMVALALVSTLDERFAAIWTVFLLGYALAPWQAMFSAVNGQKPGRNDSAAFQWMQEVAYSICGMPRILVDVEKYWYDFGIVYGAIRATLMIPGIFLIAGYTHSWVPLIGLSFLSMGYIYYLGGKLARYWGIAEGTGVAFAEITMGYLIITYMLICGGLNG